MSSTRTDDAAFGEPPFGTPPSGESAAGASPRSGDDGDAAAGEPFNPWSSAQETDPDEAGATGGAGETAAEEEDRRLWRDGQ